MHFHDFILSIMKAISILAVVFLLALPLNSCALFKSPHSSQSATVKQSNETNWKDIKLETPIRLLWLSASGDTSPVNYEVSPFLSWKETEDKTPTLFFVFSIAIPNIGELKMVDEGNMDWTKLNRLEDGSYSLLSSNTMKNQSFIFKMRRPSSKRVEQAGLLVEILSDSPFVVAHSSCISPSVEWTPILGEGLSPLYVGISCVNHKLKAHLPKTFGQSRLKDNTYSVYHIESTESVGILTLKGKAESTKLRSDHRVIK